VYIMHVLSAYPTRTHSPPEPGSHAMRYTAASHPVRDAVSLNLPKRSISLRRLAANSMLGVPLHSSALLYAV